MQFNYIYFQSIGVGTYVDGALSYALSADIYTIGLMFTSSCKQRAKHV